jgi:hypothetical protein
VNLYQLEKGFEIVADPILSGETLVLPTNKGLVVLAAARPATDVTNANKNH